MSGPRIYSRLRLLVVLVAIGVAILVDHIGSPTFRRNMGEGSYGDSSYRVMVSG